MNTQQNSKIMYNLPLCPTHNYQILNLLELRTDDARLICGSCLLNLIKTQKNIEANQIVDLIQIYDHPENTFQFTDVKQKTVLAQFLNDQIDQMNMIKQLIDQLLNELQQWQSELLQQKTIFLNIIKQDEFKQHFQLLANQNKSIKNETIQQIQEKFYNYFQSIKVMNQKDLLNWEQLQNNVIQNEKFQEVFQSINKLKLDYEKNVNYFWNQLVNTIQNNVKKQVQQIKGIYQSLQDGLTFEVIKKVIIGKDNLLFFFKSSNNGGTEFGAFTPYIWNEGYAGTNNSNPSFLFSKTLNQIYPIIQNNGAQTQYFNHEFILFGGTANSDQDLRINPDFKSGYSRLGIGYQAPSGVDTSKYSTHLFGALDPNVVECEIYQIIFE